jgi:hypothetical protein
MNEGKIELRESVKWFAEQMETRLKQNDYRGGWNKEILTDLYFYLEKQQKELKNALYEHYGKMNNKRLIKEAVDLANYAMMIAENAKNGSGV